MYYPHPHELFSNYSTKPSVLNAPWFRIRVNGPLALSSFLDNNVLIAHPFPRRLLCISCWELIQGLPHFFLSNLYVAQLNSTIDAWIDSEAST